MARGGKLTAKEAATKKSGKYRDGNCLELHVSETGAGHWVCNFTMDKKRGFLGLGSRATVSLAEAREANVAALKSRDAGVNPIEAKRKAATAAKAKPTFGAVADALIAAKQSAWRNPRHRLQWRVTLETYAKALYPLPVDEIDTAAVLAVLTPLWQRAPETASRVRGRIEAVLDAAKARGFRSGENPAAWRGHLSNLLPKRGILTRGHHAAAPYAEVPAFVARLRELESVSALAIEFLVLTAVRLGEALGATWGEIDMSAGIWTIPAARMNSGKEHRVPLCDRAIAILERMREARTGELVFPGYRAGRPLAGAALLGYARKRGALIGTLHGLRSSFRDWAGNETHFPREVCEQALAHAIGNEVERSYRRGDALEKRRALMDAWANYLAEPARLSNVIPLRPENHAAIE
jgi:integrase